MSRGDQRGDGVAGGHHEHLDDRPGGSAGEVWPREHRHAGQPGTQTHYPPDSEPLLAAGEAVEDRRDDR